MTTVLFYLVIAAVIGLVVFFLAVLVFGRGEQMAPLDPRTSPAELPDHDIDSEDVRKIRFALALRGYRMSDVDWTLERLGAQIDSLRLENAHLRDLSADQPAPLQDPATTDDLGPALSSDLTEGERWAPQNAWPTHQADQANSTWPQEQVHERLAEREAAPSVDR